MARIRIIAGEFGGRYISADVARSTHPMGDRVRSALFSKLDSMDVIKGSNVLDAFSGTGAIGLEAISRGADKVTFIDNNKITQKVIKNNIASLNVQAQTKLICSPVNSWALGSQGKKYLDESFDLIFADPPYHNPQFSTVFGLFRYLKTNGLMILSYQARLCVPYPNEGVVVVDNRSYGEAALVVLRKVAVTTS